MSSFPPVTADMAATWVAEGRVAALLDGLDEVDDSSRAQLAAVLIGVICVTIPIRLSSSAVGSTVQATAG